MANITTFDITEDIYDLTGLETDSELREYGFPDNRYYWYFGICSDENLVTNPLYSALNDAGYNITGVCYKDKYFYFFGD